MMQPSKAPAVTGEWECTECGYIEEGNEARRPAQCPECDAPAESFEFYAYEDDDWEVDEEELSLLDGDDNDLYGDDFEEDEEPEDDEDTR